MGKYLRKYKVCSCCHRRLPRSAFYESHVHPGQLYSKCKECKNKERKLYYKHVREGVLMKDGRLVYHKGFSTRIYWTQPMIDKLTRLFPITKNDDIAIEMSLSNRTITRKARELGLVKSEAFIREVNQQALEKMKFVNRFRPHPEHANLAKVGIEHRFQKGNVPPTLSEESRRRSVIRRAASIRENKRRLQNGLPKMNLHEKHQLYKLFNI